jgi:IclR family KDG regulon transcriptional repressor
MTGSIAVEGRRTPTGRYFIEAVGKAIEVLWAFRGRSEGLTIDEATAQTHIAKSSVYRLLCTLVDTGILEFESESGRYFLGAQYFQLAASAEPNIKRVAEPFMRKLWTQVQETINLGVLNAAEVLFLSRIVSPDPFRLEMSAGGRAPLYCTALGKAMAAHLPWEQVESTLREKKMRRLTSKTITNPRRFSEEMAKIRRIGYAVDDEEIVEGGRCVASSIFDAEGKIVGALSISGPATRISSVRVPELAAALKETCSGISERLGFRRG